MLPSNYFNRSTVDLKRYCSLYLFLSSIVLYLFYTDCFSFVVGVSMVSGQLICRDVVDPLDCTPPDCQQKCYQKHPGGKGQCWQYPNAGPLYCLCTFIC